MEEKKLLFALVVLSCVCACTGQTLPPMPQDAINITADPVIESQNAETGDVVIQYTLFLENVSDTTLETVILKDFKAPNEIVMEKGYFTITNLRPGETNPVVFRVIVEGWGLNPRDQTWEVGFTIRIEENGSYMEEDVFYYQIHLYPE
ncbi:MAG: hypothetical protein PVF58_09330 [Candidatus Methanofastidiosia archaeon]|jgi:hypothetical protein